MSKREYIARNLLIINFLKRGPSPWSDIEFYLDTQSEIEGYNYTISQRTFQREIETIRSLYHIDIQCDKSTGFYFINKQDEGFNNNSQLLDSFNLYHALSLTSNYSEYIQFDSRIPKGTEHVLDFLHAIKNKIVVEVVYHKFYESEAETVAFKPYLVKQFKGRWYVIGVKIESNGIRTYALDRIIKIITTKQKFIYNKDLDIVNYFKNCFGIIAPKKAEQPERIVFSFEREQANYINTFPLHYSQKTLNSTPTHVTFEIEVHVTYDLIMELLSYGEEIQIVSPQSLIDQVVNTAKEVLKKY